MLAESDRSGTLTNEYVLFGGKQTARVAAQGNVDPTVDPSTEQIPRRMRGEAECAAKRALGEVFIIK